MEKFKIRGEPGGPMERKLMQGRARSFNRVQELLSDAGFPFYPVPRRDKLGSRRRGSGDVENDDRGGQGHRPPNGTNDRQTVKDPV